MTGGDFSFTSGSLFGGVDTQETTVNTCFIEKNNNYIIEFG